MRHTYTPTNAHTNTYIQVDACLTRLLGLLRGDDDEDFGCLTLAEAAQRLVVATGDEGGEGGRLLDGVVQDLENYIALCEKMNASKFELPLHVAVELRAQVCGVRETEKERERETERERESTRRDKTNSTNKFEVLLHVAVELRTQVCRV